MNAAISHVVQICFLSYLAKYSNRSKDLKQIIVRRVNDLVLSFVQSRIFFNKFANNL
jgi:hypothetical protein